MQSSPRANLSTGPMLPGPGFQPVSGLLPPAPQPASWRQVEFHPAVQPAPAVDGRCAEKGCVFPASPGTSGRCLHHHHQVREPILFSSHQPTHVVLDRGRFEIPEVEVDTSRSRDRRRLAAIREAFLED